MRTSAEMNSAGLLRRAGREPSLFASPAYSAPSAPSPMTVLQCTVYVVQLSRAPTCRSAIGCHISNSPVREFREEEQKRDQRRHGDDQRADEQRAEQLVIVLEVHVERDD